MKRNHFTSLLQFMRRWDSVAAPLTCSEPGNRISRGGRINLEGSETCSAARTYTRWDTEFVEVIEPGVRRLVLTLVEKFDCITYSSCEGHPEPPNGGTVTVRHVGILPRDSGEYEDLIQTVRGVAAECNRQIPGRGARVSVVERTLSSEDIEAPCFEILFEREGSGWPAYFNHLEEVYGLFLDQLIEEAENRTTRS